MTAAPKPSAIADHHIELRTERLGTDTVRGENEPFTVGIPLPKGAVQDCSSWALTAANGALLPMQTRALDRWSDGSLRWVLLDSQLPAGSAASSLWLRTFDGRATTHPAPISATATAGSIRVATGASTFVFSTSASALLDRVECQGAGVLSTGSELRILSGRDAWRVEWTTLAVEEAGAVRTVVGATGRAIGPSNRTLNLRARVHLFAGIPAIRLALTVTNPSKATHPDGYWELGDPGSILLKELALVFRTAPPASARQIRWSSSAGAPWQTCSRSFAIYQDSSGGSNWKSTNHVDRTGAVPLAFQGYRVVADGAEAAGARATPIVVQTVGDSPILGVAVPAFWQNFPRAVSATEDALTVSFWPDQSAGNHELQGGEQKTHECVLLFGADPVSEQPLAWARSPLLVHPTPEWYAAAGASPYLVPADMDPHADHRALVNSAIDGDDTFLAKRERADEYGWRHFGDIYGDHEAVLHRGPTPLMSHYNNQYDPIGGFARQFMGTGDSRWWIACQELAAHVVDIDIYHTTEDKSAYNNGLFWHTVHYVDAGKATHRTYPRAKGSNGGGPASEQNYPTGLGLRYFMTGDEASREAAIGLARFVVDIDDGRRTIFGFLDRGATGLASSSRSPDYHGPGRGSGNSLNALVDGHRLTGDALFINKAEELIRRCTHPNDDVAARDLLDVENRWFYTMYMQALGKYLDHKAELGQVDDMYSYGREVLLAYARWMADHERPYLSVPEILEYPNETWPAQDIRKSEVFDFAAMHAAGAERARFLERAQFFFNYSTSTLKTFETRALARPVVLMLVHGAVRAWTALNGVAGAPPPGPRWRGPEQPPVFVPQKVRAKQRALALAAIGGVVAIALLTRLALALFR